MAGGPSFGGNFTLKTEVLQMKCWDCGKKATKTRELAHLPWWADGNIAYLQPNSKLTQRCYCDECFEKMRKTQREENDAYIRLKKRRMLENALDILEHQHIKIYEYRAAAKAVEAFLEENLDKFDSSYEVLAAIILVKNRIRCKLQYKIGRYQVDMLLPDLFVVLEIDGDRHKYSKTRDSERDVKIKMALGSQWEIVRIKTDYLDEHADRLLDAIKKVCDYRAFKEY